MKKLKIQCFILACLFSLPMTVGNAQQIIYVDQNATGGNDGTSWADAFPDLQDALASAQSDDQIWVSAGVYKPTNTTNILVSFQLRNDVKIYGGFSGIETTLEARNWEQNLTELSGDLGQIGYAVDNSKHVVTGIGIANTLLDGFKICDGAAYDPEGSGGAIYFALSNQNIVSHPTIANCTFENNFAYRGGAVAVNPGPAGSQNGRIIATLRNCHFKNNIAAFGGGAVSLSVRGMPGESQILDHCSFENNTIGEPLGGFLYPASGGAIAISTDGGTNAGLLLDHCNFIDNHATSNGGAVFFKNFSELDTLALRMRNCVFKNNTAVRGGALLIESESTSTTHQTIYDFEGCIFENNSELDEVYPSSNILLYNTGNLPDSKCTLAMDRCTIVHNQCTDCTQFELIAAMSDLDVSIANSFFWDNNSGVFSISNSGNPTNNNDFHFEMYNSVFANNEGCLGLSGGIFNDSNVKGRVVNSTFVNNNAFVIGKSHTLPGASHPRHDSLSIENCILWNPNVPASRTFYNAPIFNGEVDNLIGYTIHHSLIAMDTTEAFLLPGSGTAFGMGLLYNQWPQFLDTLNGDFRVDACSPAVNMGQNSAANGWLTDIDLLPRIAFDTIDMGAYECQDSCKNVAVHSVSKATSLVFYPNPSFDGQITFDLPDIIENQGVIHVSDIAGNPVLEQQSVLSSRMKLEFSNLPQGIYLIRLQTVNQCFTGRWIKVGH